MKKIVSTFMIISTFIFAELNLPDILFHSNYSVSKQTTDEQRVDRAYKGYCIYLLYLPNDYVDLKLLHAEYEIKEHADNDDKLVYTACKNALDKSLTSKESFKKLLLGEIKKK